MMCIVLKLTAILLLLGASVVTAMDIQVKDRDIQEFLPWLASETGNNLIISPDIKANISLSLKEVEWVDVMALIAQQYHLYLSWRGDTAMLSPTIQTSSESSEKTRVCRISYWPIHNTMAGEINQHLTKLFPTLTFTYDQQTNSIMGNVCEEHSSAVTEAVSWLDKPRRQIEISARIAQVQTSSEKQIGGEWQTTLGDSFSSDVELSATGFTSDFSVSLIDGDNLLSLDLQFLETQGLANIIAEPRIVTEEGETARIESGTEVPYQISEDDEVTVEFKQAGLTLEVTPYIKVGDQIQLVLQISQDAVGELYNDVPSIDTNHITTQVMVGNQNTLVLGGIYRDEVWTTESHVPFFSRLPLIGALFRKETHRQEKVELLVFITPKLLQLSN